MTPFVYGILILIGGFYLIYMFIQGAKYLDKLHDTPETDQQPPEVSE